MKRMTLALFILVFSVLAYGEQQQYPTPAQYRQYLQYYKQVYARSGQTAPTPAQYDVQYQQYQEKLRVWNAQQKATKVSGTPGAQGKPYVASEAEKQQRATASLSPDVLKVKESTVVADHESDHGLNHVFLVTGLASSGGTNNLVIGAEYERQLESMKWLAATVSLGYVTGTPSELVILAGGVFYPYGNFKTRLTAGLTMVSGLTQGTIRMGAGYDFHTFGITISPNLNADFVSGNTVLTYALGFGTSF